MLQEYKQCSNVSQILKNQQLLCRMYHYIQSAELAVQDSTMLTSHDQELAEANAPAAAAAAAPQPLMGVVPCRHPPAFTSEDALDWQHLLLLPPQDKTGAAVPGTTGARSVGFGTSSDTAVAAAAELNKETAAAAAVPGRGRPALPRSSSSSSFSVRNFKGYRTATPRAIDATGDRYLLHVTSNRPKGQGAQVSGWQYRLWLCAVLLNSNDVPGAGSATAGTDMEAAVHPRLQHAAPWQGETQLPVLPQQQRQQQQQEMSEWLQFNPCTSEASALIGSVGQHLMTDDLAGMFLETSFEDLLASTEDLVQQQQQQQQSWSAAAAASEALPALAAPFALPSLQGLQSQQQQFNYTHKLTRVMDFQEKSSSSSSSSSSNRKWQKRLLVDTSVGWCVLEQVSEQQRDTSNKTKRSNRPPIQRAGDCKRSR
jgi:hypothetical protein